MKLIAKRVFPNATIVSDPATWYQRVETLNCPFFNSVMATMQNNYATIVNYFDN